MNIELRKLPPSSLRGLVQILECNDSWKILMDKIPKLLEKENYECSLSLTNVRKYRTEHFKLIENASKTTGRACTEILFDEWGTSGRIRPALGHLLFLLTSVELFAAADYVAVKLLNKEPPARPSDGPPAPVVIPTMPDKQIQEVERILNEINYPSSVISMLNSNSGDVNVNRSSGSNQVIVPPKIVISEITDFTPLVIDRSSESRRQRLTRQNASAPVSDMIVFSHTVREAEEVSDMIHFSQTVSSASNIVPHISDLIDSGSNNQSEESKTLSCGDINQLSTILPDLSALDVGANAATLPKEEISSAIQSSEKEQNVPALSELFPESSPQEIEIPNLSILNAAQPNQSQSSQSIVPHFDVLLSEPSNLLPVIDITATTDSSSEIGSLNSNSGSNASHNTNVSQGSQRTCASPLPNLSLNTVLPHFAYADIEVATDHFDTTPYVEGGSGRFLGSGAFGSVFLALNIGNKPVAVKKLFLNNEAVVNIEDPVTKQFRNEVEILSKYKHENLLSIIGYSCDGPTYGLLYEFMPGGALKDRLQSADQKLIWTDRMYIALGTARAVAYLHTAYTTPLIHRDIKSANILLDANNKPRLCDFGLVRLLTSSNTNTSTTAFGTSAYMAREAFRGDVSVKVDTFSFGVVLLELITGLPPLDENREGLDIVTHVEEVCEDNSGTFTLTDTKAGSWVAKGKNFSEELYQISTKCLEENKKKRPTMVEISESLAQLIKESA
ncbi:hypothetical protein PPYR_02366 [Photinus pyralis]|uniref:non-specific serine/threonine protein kinase n=1 Tax=Photinus pyralis TaxID=7054 RepID=A0A1Y1N6R9_PHOPY|nr:probable receptor-like protein kinase At5g18500 [Photinus pyralis]XP_031358713.1 probable receptor-like protein kinase At5g18500 [Photinus pyralis]KAB0805396.1 hypothetical protein PPYR_02366 [Photinus pyralis]